MPDYAWCQNCGCRIIRYRPPPAPAPVDPPAGHAAAALLCMDCVESLRARPTAGGGFVYRVPMTEARPGA